MGEELKLIDTYALSFLEYYYDGFSSNYASEGTTMDETLLAQSKTFGGDRLDGVQTEIQDQLQLYVRDWDEEQALNIYKQH
jgi:hypothetical protein